MITTAALGLLAVTASGSMVSADMISGTTNKTDVTLTEGSGTDVTPVVPDDTHDDDPSTGDVGLYRFPLHLISHLANKKSNREIRITMH